MMFEDSKVDTVGDSVNFSRKRLRAIANSHYRSQTGTIKKKCRSCNSRLHLHNYTLD